MSLFRPRGEARSMSWWGSDSMPPGRHVSEDSAMRLSSVFAAFRHIVDYVGTLPVDAYRMDGKARVDAPLPALLRRQDDPGGPGLVSWLGQAAYGLATGNAVGFIKGIDGQGFPADIAWIHWNDWQWDDAGKVWRIFGQAVPDSQVVHIPWMVPPGCKLGLSPIEEMAAVIIAGLSAQDYSDLKRGGGIPPALLKNLKKTLDPEESQAVKARAVASFASGQPFVAGADWDLTLMAIPPNQAQFVETLKMTANQIAAAFGIDSTELGGEAANSLTYTTEELRQINRAANMFPYLTRIEKGLSRYLPARQFIRLNVDARMRADLKTRTDVVGLQIADGRMSVNEARAIEDRPPVTGGDFHNVPAPKADPTNRGEPL